MRTLLKQLVLHTAMYSLSCLLYSASACVSLFVCYAAVLCKTAERIRVLFGVDTLVDPRHVVLDKGPDPPTARGGGMEVFLPI